MSINNLIKAGHSYVFRKLEIKRRNISNGLFESDWTDVSDDMLKWVSITRKADVTRAARFTFDNISLRMSNHDGKYSPSENQSSIFNDYASEQRTLVRIRAAFRQFETLASGEVLESQLPAGPAVYGGGLYGTDVYGGSPNQFLYHGIISGDIMLDGNDTATLPIKPLHQVFMDFPARSLVGFTSTGLTAEEFMLAVRDMTDGSGEYIFRPFFRDTTSGWNIQSTTRTYASLNTASSEDVIDRSVWDVMTKLAEAENYALFTSRDGIFNFVDYNQTTAPSYEIYGVGQPNSEYGNTVIKINSITKKITDYYSRVQIKFDDADTETSYFVREAEFTVNGSNTAWNYGHRTYSYDNNWLATQTANDIADALFTELSSVRVKIDLVCTFIPQLDIKDKILLTVDQTPFSQESLWDLNDWDTELTWDGNSVKGAPYSYNRREFKIESLTQDLDKLETKLILRES